MTSLWAWLAVTLNSGVPICLVAYGPLAVHRLRTSGLAGTLVEGWRVERDSA